VSEPQRPASKRSYFYTVLTSPVLIVGLLSFGASLAWMGYQRLPKQSLETITFSTEPELFEESDIVLRYLTDDGRENTVTLTLVLSSDPLDRLTKVLAQLRLVLSESGQWPAGMDIAELFWLERERRRIVVLNVSSDGRTALSVQAESNLKRSIELSLALQGVDEVFYLRDGEAGTVFLEHLAVRASLD
jgi:hypothetical protein